MMNEDDNSTVPGVFGALPGIEQQLGIDGAISWRKVQDATAEQMEVDAEGRRLLWPSVVAMNEAAAYKKRILADAEATKLRSEAAKIDARTKLLHTCVTMLSSSFLLGICWLAIWGVMKLWQ